MSFKGKEVKVAFVGDAKDLFIKLESLVKEESKKGKFNSDNQKIFNSILRSISRLKEDPQCGVQIKKKQIPNYYLDSFGVKNLWKLNLSNFWRLIYWVDGSGKVSIVSFVIDIIDHDLYNKRFKYK